MSSSRPPDSAGVRIECVCLALYFQPARTETELLALLKLGLGLLGPYQGERLSPTEAQARAFDAGRGEVLGQGLLLTHSGLAFASKKRHWPLLVDALHHKEHALSLLRLQAPVLGGSRASLARAWEFCVHAAPRLVSAVDPSFACVYPLESSRKARARPLPSELPHFELPAFFTPWVFLGAERLSEGRREELARLPAPRSRPLGAGWLVQATRGLEAQPTQALLKAFAALSSWTPSGYRQARV